MSKEIQDILNKHASSVFDNLNVDDCKFVGTDDLFEDITGVEVATVDKVGVALSLFSGVTGLATGLGAQEYIKNNPTAETVSSVFKVGESFELAHNFTLSEMVGDTQQDNILRSAIKVELGENSELAEARALVQSLTFGGTEEG